MTGAPFPPPAHLSAAAREYLAIPAAAETAYPATDDVAGWDDLIRTADVGFGAMIDALAPSSGIVQRELPGIRATEVRHEGVADDSPIYLDFHGGGLVFGGGELAARATAGNAATTGLVHWAVDYRMPPHHPFPCGLEDGLDAYRALLRQRRAEDIIVGGNSAGGNLASALLLRAREEGLPMPGKLVLLSPEVDLTESGDTFRTLAAASTVLRSLMPINRLYADGEDLADPLLSPLFGDLTGFPRTFLQSGTRDLFLSTTVRMHRALRAAGVEAELHVFEAMPHGGFGGAPEDRAMAAELRRFVRSS